MTDRPARLTRAACTLLPRPSSLDFGPSPPCILYGISQNILVCSLSLIFFVYSHLKQISLRSRARLPSSSYSSRRTTSFRPWPVARSPNLGRLASASSPGHFPSLVQLIQVSLPTLTRCKSSPRRRQSHGFFELQRAGYVHLDPPRRFSIRSPRMTVRY